MKIISVVNQKGGTAKTTTLINLSAYLARFGKKVLIIDLDPQANASSGLGVSAENRDKGIYEILSGKIPLTEGLIEVRKNFWLIPANENLAGANIEIVNLEDREFLLTKALKPLAEDFDFVFFDTPPSLGLMTINSLVASSSVLIPVQAEYFALEGLGQLLNTINLIKENLRPDLSVLGAILTMYDTRGKLSADVWEELYKFFPHKIYRTVIPRNVYLAEAPSYGKTILEYAPRSRGAKAYHRLAREFVLHNNN